MKTICQGCKTQVCALAPRLARRSAALPLCTGRVGPARQFGSSGPRGLLSFGVKSVADSYRVLGASEALFKACAAPADYQVPAWKREEDCVEKREDGEELGEAKTHGNVWHRALRLPVSFNTWSHVTMLHLYLINARLRCFGRETYRTWQQQLTDHFFFEAEKKMHLDHAITSSALRQRYLKDLFVQWRGLLLAYDEGLIAGDAILASALWRNLCKGDATTDPCALLALVGWIRSGLVEMEAISDAAFPHGVKRILERSIQPFWMKLDGTFQRGPEGDLERGPDGELVLRDDVAGSDVFKRATLNTGAEEREKRAAALVAAIKAGRKVK
ncbi:hypothetical protein CDD81_4094 [Ophiocordyceps australis]|uniref:Ubiquinol-cytochrome c chaperone domain-containing protein n=1 Tax=Ophiocordyceps australis TaxID=1399860 RepID=A0A2C5YAK3_9HYPO|nr:hypothetical protein CDD81_4094 [Ophiocordyceps australis]